MPHTGHTLGVAIVIEPPAGEFLDAARLRYEPDADQMPAHITVLAPIDVDEDAVPSVFAHLAEVASKTTPFDVTLQGTGTFRPISPVVFVNVTEGARECSDLEAQVRAGVLGVDTRFPYHPHVTLAHDVADEVLDRACDELADFRSHMHVSGMGLFEHADGRWTLMRHFAFAR